MQFINNIEGIVNTFEAHRTNWVWDSSYGEHVFTQNSSAVNTLLNRISGFGVNKFLKKVSDSSVKYDLNQEQPDYILIIRSMDAKKELKFELVESDEDLPPNQKKFLIINKNTGEIYEANLNTLYTYFTDQPYQFYQVINEKKESKENGS